MKRLLLFLYVLCAIPLLAQSTYIDTTSTGAEAKKYVSTIEDEDHGRLPVILSPAQLDSLQQPEIVYVMAIDSIKGRDTTSYNFNHIYYIEYTTIANRNATTADTLVFEHNSSTKGSWTSQQIGLKSTKDNSIAIDNTLVIIPAATAYTYEIIKAGVGEVRWRPKTTTGRGTTKIVYVSYEGIK